MSEVYHREIIIHVLQIQIKLFYISTRNIHETYTKYHIHEIKCNFFILKYENYTIILNNIQFLILYLGKPLFYKKKKNKTEILFNKKVILLLCIYYWISFWE